MAIGNVGRKVLVTGGSGLIGSVLVRELLGHRCDVRVLDVRYGSLHSLKANPRLHFVGIGGDYLRGGIADKRIVRRATAGVDVVYHLAINWDGATWKHNIPVANLFDVNIRGTLNLLEAGVSQGVKHFLFSSSAAVYGETQRTLSLKQHLKEPAVMDEESTCKPELWEGDPGPGYAILKLTTEKLCLMYGLQHALRTTVFRIEYVFANEAELNDYANIHVDDVVSAFLLATLNKRAYGKVFNLAYPSPHISTKKIRASLGWKPKATSEILHVSHLAEA